MTAATDFEHLLQCLAHAYIQWIPSARICVCMTAGDQYTRTQVAGFASHPVEGTYPIEHGLAGKSLRLGVSFFIGDQTEARGPVSALEELACEYQARSLMLLPLRGRDSILGCLEITSHHPDQFSPLEYHLALLVAAHLSSALQNILARQQLAETNDRLRCQERRLTELNERLKELALTDDLTGLNNKRRLMLQLDFELARARRYGGDLSCLMIDINDFKQVNDVHGHPAGDAILCQMGSILRASCRVTDFVARYGGDEFTVILPQTSALGAMRVAEKLRNRAQEHLFCLESGLRLRLAVSIGLFSCFDPHLLDPQGIIAQADRALYESKRNSGACVCAAIGVDEPEAGSRNCQPVRMH